MRVTCGMVDAYASQVQNRPVIVASPRACDAVGDSLRRIYGQPVGLPSELVKLLQKLS
ncbi:hypothetical protein [Sphingomonas sp. RS2018]